MQLNCAGRLLDLSMPRVVGILNITTDSFADGGCYLSLDAAIKHAVDMVAYGAAMIDVGGESTRPGAQPVAVVQELDRVIPVITALQQEINVPISIDTSKAEVMQAAVQAGAGFINDVRALCEPGALAMAKACAVPVCLMHMQGEPRTMQQAPAYEDVVVQVQEFLSARVSACLKAGIARQDIVLDPGFGFGKTVQHNLLLINKLNEFKSFGMPLMLGVSRKSTIGSLLQRPVDDRVAGGLALTALAVNQGVTMIRTHDVKETVDAVNMVAAVACVDKEEADYGCKA